MLRTAHDLPKAEAESTMNDRDQPLTEELTVHWQLAPRSIKPKDLTPFPT